MKLGYLVGLVAALLGGLAAYWRKYLKTRPPAELDDFLHLPAITIDHSVPVSPPEPAPAPLPPNPTPTMDFSTPKAAYHSVRVICDEMGLPLMKNVKVNGVAHYPKDIICACIFQESRFNNKAVGRNAHSADYGLVQINDKIWAGPGEPFSSAQDIVDHPEKAVRFMVRMYQKNKLSLWVSYTSGAYKQWLIPNSPMWGLAK